MPKPKQPDEINVDDNEQDQPAEQNEPPVDPVPEPVRREDDGSDA